MRTFSPMTESTDTSTSSPIMMLWLDLRVRTSIRCTFLLAARPGATPNRRCAKHSLRTGESEPTRAALRERGLARRSLCASLPDRPCLVNHCARTSTRSAPGSARAVPTPGSPTSSRSACATSNSSSVRTISSRRTPPRARRAGDYPDEIDLRAEDDALIAAELEAAELEAERAKAEAEEKAAQAARRRGRARTDEEAPEPRARRRRGGRGRSVLGSRSGARLRPAGGHVRPRRGGLRAVARPGHPGQPDLRRALGRTPARRGRSRRGLHRHPPHRRRRLAERLLAPISRRPPA